MRPAVHPRRFDDLKTTIGEVDLYLVGEFVTPLA